MKRIKILLPAFLLTLVALWLMADTLFPTPLTYFSFRTVFVQLSGIVAIGAMSAGMVLAIRPKRLEPYLDGLDKMYRLHKWLGISALVAGLAHWWFAKGTKWMVGWGWLIRPERKPRAAEQFGLVEGWLRQQRDLAENLGEWAFYAAVVLIALALIKRFPYHRFTQTHKCLAAVYIVLAYHTAVLMKFSYWSQPVGWIVGLLAFSGTLAALIVLSGRIGIHRRVQGKVASVTEYPKLNVIETELQLEPGWAGHEAGQFAFVTVDRREGPHPYTIASAWQPEKGRLVFITKALGDHTRRLRELLKVGLEATVEGPYGCFDFIDEKPHQIWIGAGIGITPFIARMKQRAMRPDAQTIDLFHPTADFDPDAIGKLKADADAANVRLHVLVSGQDGRLDGERIRQAVPAWQNASLWFCGPSTFGQSLRKDLTAHGLPDSAFHQELFQMR